MTPRKRRAPGTFGTVEKLPSGHYRARYWDPDRRHHSAPIVFTTKRDARAWLALKHAEIIRNEWLPTQRRPSTKLTLGAYADDWLKNRQLKPRTRHHYAQLLRQHIGPTIGTLPLASITAADVRSWHANLDPGTPTARAHAYALLRTILGTAASDGKISANPCVIRGAGNAARVKKIWPATLDELETITNAMPQQYSAMILLASWCAMRFGEICELKRADVDVAGGVVRVRRAVVRIGGGFEVGTPKSSAGVRDVAIPPHLLPAIEAHLANHVGANQDALLFPAQHGGHLAPATFYRWYYPAREAAGRPDLRFHDLRHSGAVLAAQSGATLAELMARLGHSTAAAALRYQHAAKGRDREIAALLSKLVDNKVR